MAEEISRREFLKFSGAAAASSLIQTTQEFGQNLPQKEWGEIESQASKEDLSEIEPEKKQIQAPSETGHWRTHKFLVYKNESFPEAHNYYGIRTVVESPTDKLTLGWTNGIGIAEKSDNGILTNYDSIQIAGNVPGTVVTDIAPTNENGTYFGGTNSYHWLSPEGLITVLPDSSDITGRLRGLESLQTYGLQAVGHKETAIYFIQNGRVRKWITPLRNDLGRQDEIFALLSNPAGEEPNCYGVVAVNDGNNFRNWHRHLYRFDLAPKADSELQIQDLGELDQFIDDSLREFQFGPNGELLYAVGNNRCRIHQLSLKGQSLANLKPGDEYQMINRYLISKGEIWTVMDGVGGLFVSEKPFSEKPITVEAERDLLANTYLTDLCGSQESLFLAHQHLTGDQMNNGLLTQLVEEHHVNLPFVAKK